MRSAITLTLLLGLSVLPARAQELRLSICQDDVDLEGRMIHFSLGTAAASAQIQLFSPEGELMHEGSRSYDGAAPGRRLSIGWPDLGKRGDNFRLELKVTDTGGNWVTFQVIRFYLEIPHKEVVFASGQADIEAQEEHKLKHPLALLKDAVAKYGKLMDVKLYVAGHTDTVGKASDNQRLSERRARAISQYFIEGGVRGIPVFVRGFGEGALAVKTADNVDRKENRRADYIISNQAPPLAGPGRWRRIK